MANHTKESGLKAKNGEKVGLSEKMGPFIKGNIKMEKDMVLVN